MGYGSYDSTSYSSRSYTRSRSHVDQIFTKKSLDTLMTPKADTVRESRDSTEHPETLPVMIWLDVTGSMGKIPEQLAKGALNTIMQGLLDKGIEHPQVLFGAIGDEYTDRAPLQIGQFESSDQLLEKWLLGTYLERGGGGQHYESYGLAYIAAARHTVTDSFEKRGVKGYLFTIGDEAPWDLMTAEKLKRIFGYKQAADITIEDALAEAQKFYHIYHIHTNDGSYGDSPIVLGPWKKLLGQNLIIVDSYKDIPDTIQKTVAYQSAVDEVVPQ